MKDLKERLLEVQGSNKSNKKTIAKEIRKKINTFDKEVKK